MYEIDFLPVESAAGPGSKSGDAIAIHFTKPNGEDMVVVIDGGFSDTGEKLAEHIDKYYPSNFVDLVISTHPDADHINGLATLLDHVTVGELFVHQPRLHFKDVSDFSNIEAVDNLIKIANSKKIPITEPFAGVTRFDGMLRILGPSESYYEQLIAEYLQSERSGLAEKARASAAFSWFTKADLLEREAPFLPSETLSDDVQTSERNSTSVITSLILDQTFQCLLTGDAGIEALELAGDEYEAVIGRFDSWQVDFFQAPHHGSRRNLGPSILDRMFGEPAAPFGSFISFISSAKASTKHPSPKVVNALKRRGGSVFATEGRSIIEPNPGLPTRANWTSLVEIPPLDEDDDDD